MKVKFSKVNNIAVSQTHVMSRVWSYVMQDGKTRNWSYASYGAWDMPASVGESNKLEYFHPSKINTFLSKLNNSTEMKQALGIPTSATARLLTEAEWEQCFVEGNSLPPVEDALHNKYFSSYMLERCASVKDNSTLFSNVVLDLSETGKQTKQRHYKEGHSAVNIRRPRSREFKPNDLGLYGMVRHYHNVCQDGIVKGTGYWSSLIDNPLDRKEIKYSSFVDYKTSHKLEDMLDFVEQLAFRICYTIK